MIEGWVLEARANEGRSVRFASIVAVTGVQRCASNSDQVKMKARQEEVHMNHLTSVVFVGVAGLIVMSTVAEAADGCGRGMYYNGRRCVPQDDDGYGRRDYGPPIGGPTLRLDLGGGRDEVRYSPPNPRFRTWNNCPQNYTVQDGLCKPYRGR